MTKSTKVPFNPCPHETGETTIIHWNSNAVSYSENLTRYWCLRCCRAIDWDFLTWTALLNRVMCYQNPLHQVQTLVIVLKWHHSYHDYLIPILKISSYEHESDKIAIKRQFQRAHLAATRWSDNRLHPVLNLTKCDKLD